LTAGKTKIRTTFTINAIIEWKIKRTTGDLNR
jgi:hypothetical protein